MGSVNMSDEEDDEEYRSIQVYSFPCSINQAWDWILSAWKTGNSFLGVSKFTQFYSFSSRFQGF